MQLQHDLRSRRVLVVDDDPDMLELLVTRLSIAGYEVSSACNGAEAVDRIRVTAPEAIVLDISMPRMDGIDVLEWIGRSPKHKDTPVMMLTAGQSIEDVQVAMRMGARDYMSKPFQKDALLMRVARLLRRRSPQGSRGGSGAEARQR